MKDGVIADFEITEKMLCHFIRKAHNRNTMVRPRIIIGIPSEVTQVEKRAVKDSALKAKASEVYLVDQAMAAAIGAGLPITEPSGNMVVDIGGGTTDIAVISLAGIVYSKSVRVAGNEMDEAIIQYIKKKYNLLIGERTAEQIKLEIGSAFPLDEPITMEIKGRDLIEGIPKTLTITDAEIREALAEPISIIVNAVRVALERTPPELSADIVDRGIVLTGGGSLLKNLDKLLREETGLPVSVAEDPLSLGGAGHGEDALRLRPAAQDQPGLARAPVEPAGGRSDWRGSSQTREEPLPAGGPGARATWWPSASRWTAAAAPRCSSGRVFASLSPLQRLVGGGGARGGRDLVAATSTCAACATRTSACRSGVRVLETAAAAAAGSRRGRRSGCASCCELRKPCCPSTRWWREVVARDGVPWFRNLTINKGEHDGVALNAPVISAHRRGGPRDRGGPAGGAGAAPARPGERASGVRIERSRVTGVVAGPGRASPTQRRERPRR